MRTEERKKEFTQKMNLLFMIVFSRIYLNYEWLVQI